MVPRDGIEPPTLCSSGRCSTTELPGLNEENFENNDQVRSKINIEYRELRHLSN